MKEEPEEYKPIEYIIGLIFFIVVGFLLFKIDPIDKVTGFFDDRSSKKVRCAERELIQHQLVMQQKKSTKLA